MSKESIVERIISDAEKEAEDIILRAKENANVVLSDASVRAERNLAGVRAEVAERVKFIHDGKAASARLDGAKAYLAERRRVIDAIYDGALQELVALDKENSLRLAERLLYDYADDGDEIVFAQNYKYAEEVLKLKVIKDKNLSAAKDKIGLGGGFILRGKTSDKDLSYGALLAVDREERQAEIAAAVFKD